MRLSRRSSLLLRLGAGFTLAFIYIPLIVIVIYAFSSARTFEWPPPGLTLEWFDKAFDNTGARDAFLYSLKTGLAGDGDRAGARHARLDGGRPLPLLRPRDDLVPGDPADRPAGHRHRHRAQLDLHPDPRDRPRPVHDRRRPRHLLHRRRLQQRDRPAAAAVRARSRRRRPTSAPAPGRPSGSSRSRTCARRWSPARCWPSRSPSTRSSSPRSPSAPATRRCRSGSSATSRGPTSCRSSTRSRCS